MSLAMCMVADLAWMPIEAIKGASRCNFWRRCRHQLGDANQGAHGGERAIATTDRRAESPGRIVMPRQRSTLIRLAQLAELSQKNSKLDDQLAHQDAELRTFKDGASRSSPGEAAQLTVNGPFLTHHRPCI